MLVAALGGIGIAAVGGWLAAGGTLPSVQALFGQQDTIAITDSVTHAPVHVDSTPAGAVVEIDGKSRGTTPLDLWLPAGKHSLSLQHPDTLQYDQPLPVTDRGTRTDIALWRSRPDVLALRPVYPGAALLDARFVDDGQLALLVGTPQPGGAGANLELWRFDPATAQPTRVNVPAESGPISAIAMAPDADLVAYVKPGTSRALSASLWPADGTVTGPPERVVEQESVWVAPLDGSEGPWRIFELPPRSGPGAAVDPERIVDLAWTPDESRVVAITRQPGTPLRSRVFVLDVNAAAENANPTVSQQELVLLPAQIVAGSAEPDSSGRWLAFLAHAASAPGGRDVLNLCVLELRPGGAIFDLADLSTAAPAADATSVAWEPPTYGPSPRLVFAGPAPVATPTGGGLFGIFDLFDSLRPSAPPSGLYVAGPGPSGADAMPRRLGSATNTIGPVWRSSTILFGFARQNDGTLSLRSIDSTSGAVQDLGVRLPAGTGQGTAGLFARWDTRHGEALLLGRQSTGAALNASTDGGSLLAWLVLFVPPGSTAASSN
jgi:hypothetical protein